MVPRVLRFVSTGLATVLMVVVVSACGGGGSSGGNKSSAGGESTPPPKAGGTLTMLEQGGYSGDWPTGLDPATNTTGGANLPLMNAIYGQLFQLNEKSKLEPDLATGYEFSNGGKTVLIHLRKGVKFSDGTPFNAQAVIFNIKRDVKSDCTCKPIWQLKSVSAPDPYTVRIDLAVPDGALINSLQVSNVNWIASPTALKKMGEQKFKIKPVGAGPFTVVSDKLSSQLVLKKNPNYWQKGRPYLDRLIFKTTANDETALETMQAGQAQAYEGMSTPTLLDSFRSRFRVTTNPSTSPYVIQLNTAAPPFDNRQARLAIYYATNAPVIDEKLFHNQQPNVESFIAPAGLFYDGPKVSGYPEYDLAKAKQIVKSLGGLSVNFFTLDTPVNQNFMKALQTMWKQAGIDTTIHLYSLNGLIQEFNTKTWQAALQTAGAWDPAAGVGVTFRFSSRSPFSGVHDPKLDALLGQAQGSTDAATRKKLYAQAGEYIARQAYAPFMFPVATYNIAAPGVVGPGLTTSIPSVAVNPAILWQDVYINEADS